MANLRIGLPSKGRLAEVTAELLKEAGLSFRRQERSLFARCRELPVDITAIVSNHPAETYAHLDLGGVPFHHMPVTKETKLEQEAALWSLIEETGTA